MKLLKNKYGQKLGWHEAWPKIVTRLYNYWLDFELFFLTLVGYCPVRLLRHFWYRLAGIKIGKGSTIHMWARFYDPKNITVGCDTIIGDHAFLDGRTRLAIGSHVDIASQVMIYNSEHDVNSAEFSPVDAPVEIGDYCFVGPRAIILPGVKVGRGAIIGAGAVVTKDIAEFAIAAGVPAVKIGERKSGEPRYVLGRSRLFQ